MQLNQIFELTMVMDTKNFIPLLNEVFRNTTLIKEGTDHLIDDSLEQKGVLFLYRNSNYQKKVKVITNTDLLLNGEDPNPYRLLKKLKKKLGKYMNGRFHIDQFFLSKVTTTTNVNIGNEARVDSYLNVLRRIGRVKGFTPVESDYFTKDNSFYLEGNSNHTEFGFYSLNDMLRRMKKADDSRGNGIVVVEVRLNKPSAIRSYCDNSDVSEQIASLYKQRAKVFFDTMTRIIPDGAFLKKQDAIDYVRLKIKDTRLRRRMIGLISLIPEKRSLLLAQKALNYRHVDVVMEEFRKIGLSPVTIGKRQDIKYLESIYSYMM